MIKRCMIALCAIGLAAAGNAMADTAPGPAPADAPFSLPMAHKAGQGKPLLPLRAAQAHAFPLKPRQYFKPLPYVARTVPPASSVSAPPVSRLAETPEPAAKSAVPGAMTQEQAHEILSMFAVPD